MEVVEIRMVRWKCARTLLDMILNTKIRHFVGCNVRNKKEKEDYVDIDMSIGEKRLLLLGE